MAYTSVTRMLGLNSGIDTEGYVKSLMKAESLRLTKLKKSAMLISFRQEQYRKVSSDLKSFQSSFLDVTKSGGIRSDSTFAKQTVSVKTSAGENSGAVTVGAGAKAGTYSVKVDQLAVADLYESKSKIGGDINSAKGFTFDVSNIKNGAGYDITLDGVTRKISFNEGDAVSGGTLTFENGTIGVKDAVGNAKTLDEQEFIDVFNEKLKSAFGTEGINGKQEVEARLTESGGISIFTNGYHKSFSIADGNYVFSGAVAENKSALADGPAEEGRELGLFVKVGDTSAKISVSVTEGMTQKELVDSLNEQLKDKGLDNKVYFHVDQQTGNIKAVNFSSSEQVEISDHNGAKGSMEYLGFSGVGEDSKIKLSSSSSLNAIGITSGSAAKFSDERTLSEIFGDNLTGEKSFTINGKSFSFTGDTKLSDLMKQVNDADIGVNLRYDEVSATFKLESNSTGYAGKISMSGELLTDNLGFGDTAKRAAANSAVTINGVTLINSTNEFEYQGVEWKLNQTTGDGVLTVKVEKDAESIVDSIKSFVDGYNALIQKLNSYTSTSRPKSNGAYYEPLTDDEKAEMSEKEIEKWEEEAKKGLLYNDSILTQITRDLRSALNQSVTLEDGSKISLSSIGITTSSDWTKGGQLEIDEDKLRKAIEAYGDDVTTLFTKASSEGGKGLAERVNDIVSSAVSTNGSIANKAGIEGTHTESNNELYRQLKTKNDKITAMIKQLETKETRYYNMFARLESAMSKYNSQSEYITSMFGGS